MHPLLDCLTLLGLDFTFNESEGRERPFTSGRADRCPHFTQSQLAELLR